MRGRLAIGILAAVTVAGVTALAPAMPAPAPMLATTSGPVRGSLESGLRVFRGVPYAAPPTGELRFKPPKPPKPWTAPLAATANPLECPQAPSATTAATANIDLAAMSEDCLKLNIWAPDGEHGGLPVMVWIHGGGFQFGSVHNPILDGAALARRGNLMVVEVQYRLGPFGFLALAPFGGHDFAQSGNLGMLDQIAALRWVRANAAAFGGDPGNVTVFGESAGGVSVALLLAAPAARGLFQRAIIESGTFSWQYVPKEDATQTARAFMAQAGATTVAQLRALPMATLVKAEQEFLQRAAWRYPFEPVDDGLFIPAPAAAAIDHAGEGRVPVLVGTNLDEARAFAASFPYARRPRAELIQALAPIFGGRASAVFDLYAHDFNGYEPAQRQVLGDAIFRIPSIRAAEHAPAWMYQFAYPVPLLGPAHATELGFVFGNLPPAIQRADPNGSEHVMSQMQAAWIAFAQRGDPNPPEAPAGMPHWPQYDANTRATMIFDVQSRVVSDPHAAERRAWDGVSLAGPKPTRRELENLFFPCALGPVPCPSPGTGGS